MKYHLYCVVDLMSISGMSWMYSSAFEDWDMLSSLRVDWAGVP